ncbi:MAG: hypothetical protein QM765_44660 [Myxococcales bacterium]
MFFDTVLGLEAYPTLSPDALVAEMIADQLSDKWHSQDGEFASLTLRNPAPDREARIALHEEAATTAAQKKLLFDSPMAYINISVHDKEAVIVDATVFVRSSTSAEAAKAYAQKIEVELAPSDDYVRLGEHVLKLKPKEIEEAGVLYTVKVPRRFGADVRMRNGRCYVTGLAGEFRYIGGGGLIATDLRGKVWIDKTGGGTLLANVPGPQPIRLDQSSGLVGLLNIAAPIDRSNLRAAVYLDLRKAVPAGMDMEVGRTGAANVVLGPDTSGDLRLSGAAGVVIHQPDGTVNETSEFKQQAGSGGKPVEMRMTSGGKLNVWVGPAAKGSS